MQAANNFYIYIYPRENFYKLRSIIFAFNSF